jgi:molybdopterin-guanine dinucleotide biosynthesis protein MobB
MMISRPLPPTVAVCGWSGSGKTTLLEAIIPSLRQRGLEPAVVKHDAHGVQLDRPGKDSDRLFNAGATVALGAPDQLAIRRHGDRAPDLGEILEYLSADHDLVLVEGHKSTPLPKLWLVGEDGEDPPDGVESVVEILPRDADRESRALDVILEVVQRSWSDRTVLGGLLIGGASRRMGRPKQLLEVDGRTFAERIVDVLRPHVDDVVLLGFGEIPPSLTGLVRIPDSRGPGGPVAGLTAGLRWSPGAAWLMVACDQPGVSGEAVRWLLDQRRPGRWAVLPRLSDGPVEPLLAVYEPQAAALLERLIRDGRPAPRHLAGHPRVACPTPPSELGDAWLAIDTPEDFEGLGGLRGGSS